MARSTYAHSTKFFLATLISEMKLVAKVFVLVKQIQESLVKIGHLFIDDNTNIDIY